MADDFTTDETVDSLSAYLATPPESAGDTEPESDRPSEAAPDDPAQSSPADPEVAPADQEEQAETPDVPAEESAPGEDAPPEPAAVAPNWDSPENPHYVAAQQLQKIQQLYEQQQQEQAAAEQKEKFVKGISTLASDLDAADVPTYAADLFDEISTTAVQPYQEEIQRIAHGMTALVAAINELPAEQQAFVRHMADKNRQLGQTAADIERAFAIRQEVRQEQTAREIELGKQLKAVKAQLAAAAIKQSGSDKADDGPAPAARAEEPLSMLDYLSGADEEGRTLTRSPFQRRTG